MNDIFDNDIDSENESFLAVEPSASGGDLGSNAAADADLPTDVSTELQGEQGQDGTPQEQSAAPTDEDIAKQEQEIETALADERTPKWFKNAVENVYKPKLDTLGKRMEQFETFGTAEEIGQKLSLLNSLSETRTNPNTMMPERTTENFVKQLHESDPQAAYQLMNDLAVLPSPYTQGYSVLQEMIKEIGIDPSRLDDVKQFVANGYQMSQSAYPAPDAEDLSSIPQHLHAAFSQLNPDMRDELMASSEYTRNANLEAHKAYFEQKTAQEGQAARQAESQEQAEAQRVQQFRQQVETKGTENFTKASENVLNSFVAELSTKAGMSKMDSLMIANTVLNAFEPTLAGQMSRDALKAEGLELDASIQQTISELEETAKHAAAYEITGDRAMLEKTVAKQVELQTKLQAKGNKIVASLAMKRANNVLNPAIQQNAALGQTQNTRHAAAGTGSNINSAVQPNYDFSDEAYAEEIRATGLRAA